MEIFNTSAMSWGSFFEKSTSTAHGLWSPGDGTASHHHQRLLGTGLLCKLESCHHPLLLHTIFSWMLRLSLCSTWSWFTQIKPGWVLAGARPQREGTTANSSSTAQRRSLGTRVTAREQKIFTCKCGCRTKSAGQSWVWASKFPLCLLNLSGQSSVFPIGNGDTVVSQHKWHKHTKILKSWHANRCSIYIRERNKL